MSIVVVAGTPWAEPQIILDRLVLMGLKPALAVENRPELTMASWHQRVFSGLNENALEQPQQLGRAWEQAAGDIFLANWGSPNWGWADYRSTWLLEFWRDYDPQVRFVLCSLSPEQAVARALLSEAEIAHWEVARILQTWQAYEHEMLRFALRHPDRCLLVDAEWSGYPLKSLQEQASSLLQVPLALPKEGQLVLSGASAKGDPATLIAAELAQQLVAGFPEALLFYQQIQASLHLAAAPVDRKSRCQQAAESLQTLFIQRHEAQQQITVLTGERDSVRKQAEDRQQQITALTGERDQLQQDREELEQESELLLHQLHQVQEELERTFLEKQTTEATLEQTRVERDGARKQAEDRQKQITDLTGERESARKQAEDRQQQITVLTGERDSVRKQAEEQQKQLTTLTGERDQLRKAQEGQKKENELVLLQLHQVQEELERYFLQHQKAEAQLKKELARWQRLYQRLPNYLDWERIEVISVREQSPQEAEVRWRVRGFHLGARALPDFECITALREGYPALILPMGPADKPALPLHQWPLAALKQPELLLQPQGNAVTQIQRLGNLAGLGSSDWHLIQVLVESLTAVVRQPRPSGAGEWPSGSLWQLPLEQLQSQLSQLPAFWRYDTLTLTEQEYQPQYERLSFRLEQVQFGHHRWSTFEFHLVAEGISTYSFSSQPSLEFPERSSEPAPLEHWFAQSQTATGGVLRLTFDLQHQIADMATLQRLSTHDREQIKALIIALPVMMARLKKQEVRLKRAWSDWLNLISGLANFYLKLQPQLTVPAEVQPEPIPSSAVPELTVTAEPDPEPAPSVPPSGESALSLFEVSRFTLSPSSEPEVVRVSPAMVEAPAPALPATPLKPAHPKPPIRRSRKKVSL